MSFIDCVEEAVRGGVLTRRQAEELYARAQDYERNFTLDQQHSPESAARLGQEEAIRNGRRQIRLQRFQTARQAVLNSNNVRAVRQHPKGIAAGINALLGRDLDNGFGHLNVDFLKKGIEGQAHAKMAEFIAAARTTMFGLKRDRELIQSVVRELFGESTGDARASTFARSWTETADGMRQRFNRAGGAIPRRADWGMPQSHDRARVASASREDWSDFVLERLNRDAMTNSAGGRLADDELDLVVQDIYETIRTDGLSNLQPGARGGRKLANRRQDHRVLVFKDADAWLEYQARFGNPDLFQTMMDHVSSMAHDIALLEVLGPNPNAGFRYLMDVAAKDGIKDSQRVYTESLFRTVNGQTENTGSWLKLADFSDAIRSWLTAAKLGSATLSAVSDIGFVKMTTALNGMNFTKVMGRTLSQLNPANEADRILATRMGLTAMQWSQAMATANRHSNIVGRGAAGKAAEVTLRASGLTAWTDAWKRAFGMEFYGLMGENVGRGLDELPNNLRAALVRYGIDSDMWDQIRATNPLDHQGARFVSVERLLERDDLPIARREELSNRLAQMVMTETNFAVPEPDARARVFTSGALLGSGARGTGAGEFGRLTFQFKGFPVSALLFHVYRIANLKDGSINRLGYAASLLLATTLLGGLAIQLKEISRGKNPRPMADPKFWPAAAMQGGGLGIYGDFLFADANRFGGGPTSTVAGPYTNLIDDTWKLTWGNVQELIAGDEPEIGRDLIDYARRYTPGGSLWYTRLLVERELFDQAQLAVDAEAYTRFSRRMRKRERDYNQSYWWRMGETTPREAPQLEEAFDDGN